MYLLDLHPYFGGRCLKSHEVYLPAYHLAYLPICHPACLDLSHQAIASLSHLSGHYGVAGAYPACHDLGMIHQAWMEDWEGAVRRMPASRVLVGEGYLHLSVGEKLLLHCFV